MPFPLKALAVELAALQLEAVRESDDLAATAIAAGALLARLGDEHALAAMAGHLSAAALQRDAFGLFIRAARAIFAHIGRAPRESIPTITYAELLQAVGKLAVDRDRLERQVVALRQALAAAEARAERGDHHSP
jgi:hypothetical protein